MSIRNERADAEPDRLDAEIAALIKGMLKRGDRQSDIAACFLINGGRISEINTGQRYPEVEAAMDLPPSGPYPSPHELWKAKQEMWRVRVALQKAAQAIHESLVTVDKVEQR